MKYMGSKSRHAKHILPIILKDRKPDQWYVEPFVGGANVIDKVEGKRIGADINYYVIAMLDALSKGWIPPEHIDKPTYDKHRQMYYKGDISEPYLTGYIGVNGSYNGRFFDGGYAGVVTTKQGKVRDYPNEAYKNVVKQSVNLQGVKFCHSNYLDLELPPNSLVYCDIPYYGTKEYREARTKFNHDEFWQWCREKHAEGHTIFVSEYNAPDDFVCVWEKDVNSSLTKNTGAKKATEKLFTLTDYRQ
ncbi:MAG: putative DNA adenine methylase [Prokaryotic dsDNA virus sp.]|nr:MAG: putative DNA adenine methylase [Prokaryotic dsDNA virus sp.]